MSQVLRAVSLAVAVCVPFAAFAEPAAPESTGQAALTPEAAPAQPAGAGCHRGCAWSHREWSSPPPATRVSLEVGGAGAWHDLRAGARLSVKPVALPRWSFGLGVYSSPATWRFSSDTVVATGQGLSNVDASSDATWSQAIRQGYDVSATRYFGCRGTGGLYLSARVGAAEMSLRNSAVPGAEARPWFVTLTPEIGVQWFPLWQRTFFLRPHFMGEFRVASIGSTAVGDVSLPWHVFSLGGGLNLGIEL